LAEFRQAAVTRAGAHARAARVACQRENILVSTAPNPLAHAEKLHTQTDRYQQKTTGLNVQPPSATTRPSRAAEG
jgi:hypothetical protein